MGTTFVNTQGRDGFLALLSHYRAETARQIGAELELYIVQGQNGEGLHYVPAAAALLERAWGRKPDSHNWLHYEVSACQIEVTTDPCRSVEQLVDQLFERVEFMQSIARELGYELVAQEWVPFEADLPEDVYPDQRYIAFLATHPDHAEYMRRVASLQFHFGVATFDEALRVHHDFVVALPEFIDDGWAHPARVAAFHDVIFAPGWFPPAYRSADDLWAHALERGFHDQPANNWSAVRLHHRWPTVELRIGGATLDRATIHRRASRAWQIAFG